MIEQDLCGLIAQVLSNSSDLACNPGTVDCLNWMGIQTQFQKHRFVSIQNNAYITITNMGVTTIYGFTRLYVNVIKHIKCTLLRLRQLLVTDSVVVAYE